MSEYSIRALFANVPGLTWPDLADPNNGMYGAWVILAAEWPVFMVLGWYLEQVGGGGGGGREEGGREEGGRGGGLQGCLEKRYRMH